VNLEEVKRYIHDGIVSVGFLLELLLEEKSTTFRNLGQRTLRVMNTPILRQSLREYAENNDYTFLDVMRMTATGIMLDFIQHEEHT